MTDPTTAHPAGTDRHAAPVSTIEPRAMAPDPGEPPADDRDILAAYECPAGGLCGCRHQDGPHGQGRWPRCSLCGCACSLPDPDDAPGDPHACPCCHYSGPV